jgi:hypothetical protein
MDPALLTVLVPALTEIAKEIIGLFRTKKTNPARRGAAKRFIRKRYPDLKEHLQNLLVELFVFAHKQGMDEEQAAAYVEAFLIWNKNHSAPTKPVEDEE